MKITAETAEQLSEIETVAKNYLSSCLNLINVGEKINSNFYLFKTVYSHQLPDGKISLPHRFSDKASGPMLLVRDDQHGKSFNYHFFVGEVKIIVEIPFVNNYPTIIFT